MKNLQLIKEALVATVIALLLTYIISFIPFKFEFVKVIKQGSLDMDIYDLYYSGRGGQNVKRDPNIVLVQVAADRASIARQVTIINGHQPALIGLDVIFSQAKDAESDTALVRAIDGAKNIVLSTSITDDLVMKKNFFDSTGKKYASGFTNFAGARYSVVREYAPFVQLNDQQYFAFTSRIVEVFSPIHFTKLKRRNNRIEIINYSGNLGNYTSITADELLQYQSSGQLSEILKGKIVLLGFFVKQPPLVIEDLYFSPLNEVVAGKSNPDIYGLVIHANILSMILSEDYVHLASAFFSYACAFVLTFLMMLYILKQYSKPKHPAHWKLLLVQLLIIILLFYLFLQIYNWFQFKMPISPVIISPNPPLVLGGHRASGIRCSTLSHW